jgi:catechol 2,3-dioxygenase-like lactoylglutathione lyase family enzyme
MLGRASKEETALTVMAVSHVAVGVRDMERALRFYRDVIGLRVRADLIEEIPAFEGNPARKRRGVYLCWSEGPRESFLVLDQQQDPFGEPARVFQVGIHHFGFWVDDVDGIAERARSAGFRLLTRPGIGDTKTYGEPPGGKVKSCFLLDPDGNCVQVDQRL